MSAGDVREAIEKWAEESGCRLCVLFGSRARAGPPVERDVDLALWFEKLPDPARRLRIIGELQDACGSDGADVVFLHERTDPVLRFEVFRGGEPLYEDRRGLFIDEKVRALMLYDDALPFRRALRSRLRRLAEEDRLVP